MSRRHRADEAHETLKAGAEHSAHVEGTPRLPVTAEALLDMRAPMDAQISPDGARVAFTLFQRPPDQQKAQASVWIVETSGQGINQARPISPAGAESYAARWSPDGRWLAFISMRNTDGADEAKREKRDVSHKPQVFIMPAPGKAEGKPWRVSALPNGVGDISWSPDSRRLAFTSLEGPEPSRDPIVVAPSRHRRLWTVYLDTEGHALGQPQPVTPDNLTVWEYAWAPDGKTFAVYYSVGPDETDWYRGLVGSASADGGAVRELAQPQGQAGALTWSLDGARVAYVSGEWSDRGLVGGDVFVVDASGGKPHNLTPGIGFSPSWLRWTSDGAYLLYAGWDGLGNQVGVLREADGALTPLSEDFLIGERAWPRLSLSADGRLCAVTHSSATQPTEITLGTFTLNESGLPTGLAWRRLTRLNPIQEETLAVVPSQAMRYEGADGWPIDALYTPPLRMKGGKTPDEPPPLLVLVHGGPTSAFRDEWGGFVTQVYAAAGYATLRVNVRGSMGRGVAFANAVLGDMGGKDFEDLMRGVEQVIARGLADPKRMGIFGWSYGGFMTAWAISQTTRFKAAVMGAGIADFHSFHAQTNIRDWDMRFLAANPVEQPDVYRARSAITYAHRLVTPTLIIHGEQDACVPVNQAYALYYALRERAVPTELVVYPREGHGFAEHDHQLDWIRRMMAWFKQYV